MLSLAEWFSIQGNFAPSGEHLAFIGDIFGCNNLGGGCSCHLLEPRGAPKRPSVHAIAALATTDYLAQIVSSAEAEKLDSPSLHPVTRGL